MIKQPVLAELQYFVSSVSLLYKGVPLKDSAAATALVKCALHLLEDLPSTRDAVFEYFSLVFNGAVKSYLSNVEVSGAICSGGLIIDAFFVVVEKQPGCFRRG